MANKSLTNTQKVSRLDSVRDDIKHPRR